MKRLLSKNLLLLIEELHENGGTCYVVGGFVRDYLLKRSSYDIDIEVHNIDINMFEAIVQRHSVFNMQGNFGIYKLVSFDNVEFSIPRNESLIGIKHNDFHVNLDPYMGTYNACIRRDFTVNSMMYNLKTCEIIDHFNGINDLNNKVLRHVSDKFCEDSLRVLRGIRFSSELGFKLDSETLLLAKSVSLDNLAIERMNCEFKRYFLGEFLYDTLEDFKFLFGERYFFNELDKVQQSIEYHPEGNAWLHTKEAIKVGIDVFENKSDEEKFVGLVSLLFHDIGKICKLSHEDITHEKLSSILFLQFANEITSKKRDIKLINNCILYHMIPRNIMKMTGNEIILILKTFGSDLEMFLTMTTADICCRYLKYEYEQVKHNVLKYQNNVVSRFMILNDYYLEMKKKYNGQYFISKNITGSQISNEQEKLLSELIITFNSNKFR